ncbi:MAG: O-antigen ligase family protein [Candidatus Promineofilum sp.]|nr:O-antigen ligase family protein [Promineifilum sp.]
MLIARSTSPQRRRLLALLSLALAALCLLAIGARAARDDFLTRGIPNGLPEPVPQGGVRVGLNIQLDRDDNVAATLDAIQALGIYDVKQSFYYQADYDWTGADRIAAAAAERGMNLVPLLDGDPATGFAPPHNPQVFADWAGEFARRYGENITHYIVWDEPNLAGHWGGAASNPTQYAALLSAAATAIRGTDPDAIIVAGPLAPTTETGPDNLAETLYLQALYEAGAGESFDVVASKPYGFDTGPEDRSVGVDRLNFSRTILLRELMLAHGDEHKAIWAGNWGWNSLPDGWTGAPSIWGQTSESNRAARTVAALERARREWPWMGVLFLENWEPNAPPDDPRWGFSIAGRATADALAAYMAAQPPDLAMPGFHFADPHDLSQQFTGNWEFSPEFGADIGQSGDAVRFSFWGTDVGVRVRRADFRARFYVTIDGRPANALPQDENGATLILTSPDATQDYISIEWLARNLPPGPHILELVASRGWDQWALNGFSVGYRPAGATPSWIPSALGALALGSLVAAFLSARGAEWDALWPWAQTAFGRLGKRSQMLVVAGTAALVSVTGWLTWGQETLGIYRRLGDTGQLAVTAAAATVFYVTPSFILFSAALLVLYGLLVLRPAWGVALIALTIPFYVPPLPKLILGYRFSPVEVFTLVATAAWLTRAILDTGLKAKREPFRLSSIRPKRADWAALAFIGVATLSLAFAEFRGVALNEWRVVVVEPFLFYVLLRVVRLRDSEMWVVIDAFVLSGVIVALYGLWQYATGQNLITAEGGLLRLRSIYGSPNNVALYLERILPLVVAMGLLGARATHGRRRWVYLAVLIPLAAALLLSFSKGALFLGIPASLAVVFWVWQRRAGRRTWPWLAAGLFIGVAAIIAASQIPAVAARFDLFGTTGFFRVSLWRAAIHMFADHPWFGVGLDNFLYAYRGRYILDAAWQEPNLNHPHNIFLDFATRLGILGLLTGGWLIWEAARAASRALRSSGPIWLPVAAGLSGALAAVLAHGLVDHSFFLIDLAFAFFLILGVSVWIGERQLKDSSNQASQSAAVLPDG